MLAADIMAEQKHPPGPPMMREFNANLQRNLWFVLWLVALNLAFALFLMLR
jgi:hypothetical protein